MFLFNIIIWIILLLQQLTFAIAEGDAPNFPEALIVVIQNDHQTINLNWKRNERFLANENLPIWLAQRRKEPELATSLMADIGPFAFYHDVEQSSAVVLFYHQQLIYGVIDTRFIVIGLPLNQVGPHMYHAVGGNYIIKRDDEDFHDKYYDFPIITGNHMAYMNSFINKEQSFEPLNHEPSSLLNLDAYNRFFRTQERASQPNELLPAAASSSSPYLNDYEKYSITDFHAGPSSEQQVSHTSHRVGDTLYAEILVFISNDVIEHFTRTHPEIKILVAYYLIHFNAIDMLYAKLAKDVEIYINIAGLVLETQPMVFPYVFMPSNGRPSHILDGTRTLHQFPKYIKRYNNAFSRDSFDFFYVSTHHRIMYEGKPHFGFSIAVNNYFNRRSRKVKYRASGILIENKSFYSDFITSAHEIAHQLHVEHDPDTMGKSCGGDQCFAILQVSDTYCRNCIRWSAQSINEFKTFASSNLDHCFMLNQPRSLQPFGVPLRTIGPNQQCICYGYHSHWTAIVHLDEVESHRCDTKLACAYDNRPVHFAIPKPIDGTPCGFEKVCWREKCEPLESPLIVQLLNFDGLL